MGSYVQRCLLNCRDKQRLWEVGYEVSGKNAFVLSYVSAEGSDVNKPAVPVNESCIDLLSFFF